MRIAVLPTRWSSAGNTAARRRAEVAHTGRLSAEKDLVTLLAAWKTLLRRLPAAQHPCRGGRHLPVGGEPLRAAVAGETLCARA